jgi:hypothetical protein
LDLGAATKRPAKPKEAGACGKGGMRPKLSESGAIDQGRRVGARGVVVGNATGAVIVTGDRGRVKVQGKR